MLNLKSLLFKPLDQSFLCYDYFYNLNFIKMYFFWVFWVKNHLILDRRSFLGYEIFVKHSLKKLVLCFKGVKVEQNLEYFLKIKITLQKLEDGTQEGLKIMVWFKQI